MYDKYVTLLLPNMMFPLSRKCLSKQLGRSGEDNHLFIVILCRSSMLVVSKISLDNSSIGLSPHIIILESHLFCVFSSTYFSNLFRCKMRYCIWQNWSKKCGSIWVIALSATDRNSNAVREKLVLFKLEILLLLKSKCCRAEKALICSAIIDNKVCQHV